MELKILKKPIKEPKGREGTPVLRDRKQKKLLFLLAQRLKRWEAGGEQLQNMIGSLKIK